MLRDFFFGKRFKKSPSFVPHAAAKLQPVVEVSCLGVAPVLRFLITCAHHMSVGRAGWGSRCLGTRARCPC